MRHFFKTDPEPFAAMRRGDKRADLRDLSDRTDEGFNVGDEVVFAEYDRTTNAFTGGFLLCRITHLQSGYILGPHCRAISFDIIATDKEWRDERFTDHEQDKIEAESHRYDMADVL